MKIIAAFLWDSSAKSISYMIVDGNYVKRIDPTCKKFDSLNAEDFEKETKKIIESFFDEIKNISLANKDSKLLVQYKIVHHGSPTTLFKTKLHQPSDRTAFIRDTFLDTSERLTKEIALLKLGKQWKKPLKKPELDYFINELQGLGLINRDRGKAYEHHLWALILKLSNKNYEKKIVSFKNKITKLLMKPKVETQEIKKPLPSKIERIAK